MNSQSHFRRQIDYQLWANQALFEALARLEAEALAQPAGGLSFLTIADTADHLLAELRLWARRLRGEAVEVERSTIRHEDWSELKHLLQRELRSLRHWLEERPEGFYDERLAYFRTGGEICHATVADVLTQLMLHLTHQRAQIAAAAIRLGAPAPAMEYIYFVRDMERAEREAVGLKAVQP